MFTGIVEELGTVQRVDRHNGGARLQISAKTVLEDAQIGTSIAVQGVCLTAVDVGDGWWSADVVVETMERTTLSTVLEGDTLNLERALRLSDRLAGHMVQGHIDGLGRVLRIVLEADGSHRLTIASPPEILRYIVEKGSVTVDGVSLTVAALHDNGFDVAVIPHTLAVTTLGAAALDDEVNLEVDVLAKYVERLLAPMKGV